MANYWQKQVIAVSLGLLATSVAWGDSTTWPSTEPGVVSDSAPSYPAPNEFLNLSLEDLLRVGVRSAAGLTASDSRRLPVDLTVLDAREIRESGARDLNHLLEDYIPNA